MIAWHQNIAGTTVEMELHIINMTDFHSLNFLIHNKVITGFIYRFISADFIENNICNIFKAFIFHFL